VCSVLRKLITDDYSDGQEKHSDFLCKQMMTLIEDWLVFLTILILHRAVLQGQILTQKVFLIKQADYTCIGSKGHNGEGTPPLVIDE